MGESLKYKTKTVSGINSEYKLFLGESRKHALNICVHCYICEHHIDIINIIKMVLIVSKLNINIFEKQKMYAIKISRNL